MFSDVGAFLNKLMTSSRLIKSFVISRALTVTTGDFINCTMIRCVVKDSLQICLHCRTVIKSC
jgi:SET domain-containing protein